MSIFNYFQHLNLSSDQNSAIKKLESFITSPTQVFLLKGYAGSGKTTILKGLINYLDKQQRAFSVMAPTGRAAKILRDKTGQGKTIHSSIYDFDNLKTINSESTDAADHSFHFSFPIIENETYEHIIIVDEASMISNRVAPNELFTFGTDILLQDLLTYARLSVSKNKIIFVGDPAQLPPVSDNNSYALEESFFAQLGLSCTSIEMKKVMRQSDNLILKNATTIREVLQAHTRNELQFEYDDSNFCQIKPEQIISKYLEFFPVPQIGNGVVIAYSNAQCLTYNRAIRERIFPNNKDVVVGDILSINNNNYHTYGTEVFNGDMAMVVNVSNHTEKQSAVVWADEGGKKIRKTITFVFRDIEIRLPSFPNNIPCKIIDSLLNSNDRDLGIDELKALYINFVMRFNDEQKNRKEQGLDVFKVGSEQFKLELKSDLYFNAMRVKYGYAVTCHKAQGGEWDTVFIDYYGQVSLKNTPLRWCYTATTRGVNRCYVINPPSFGVYSKLTFSNIVKSGTFPDNALNLTNVALSPFHNENQHRCKSLKYWEIARKLRNTSIEIDDVKSFGEFLERYFLKYDTTQIIIEAYHNQAGFFKNFSSSSKAMHVVELLELINTPVNHIYNIDYSPFNAELEKLFSNVQNYCNELDITITSIEEKIENYYVRYCFTTSGICSVIKFSFNKSFQFTTAMPNSDLGEEDIKLIALIQKLNQDAN